MSSHLSSKIGLDVESFLINISSMCEKCPEIEEIVDSPDRGLPKSLRVRNKNRSALVEGREGGKRKREKQ